MKSEFRFPSDGHFMYVFNQSSVNNKPFFDVGIGASNRLVKFKTTSPVLVAFFVIIANCIDVLTIKGMELL